MAKKTDDPTAAIRLQASQYPEVDEGTACTQSSFKTGKRAFLFVGEQGGRYKAMFKLDQSREQAIDLAEKDPDCYQVGSGPWVTARFTSDQPLPKRLWKKWLDESYKLSLGSQPGKKSTKSATAKKKASKKKTSNKKTVAAKPSQKKVAALNKKKKAKKKKKKAPRSAQ